MSDQAPRQGRLGDAFRRYAPGPSASFKKREKAMRRIPSPPGARLPFGEESRCRAMAKGCRAEAESWLDPPIKPVTVRHGDATPAGLTRCPGRSLPGPRLAPRHRDPSGADETGPPVGEPELHQTLLHLECRFHRRTNRRRGSHGWRGSLGAACGSGTVNGPTSLARGRSRRSRGGSTSQAPITCHRPTSGRRRRAT